MRGVFFLLAYAARYTDENAWNTRREGPRACCCVGVVGSLQVKAQAAEMGAGLQATTTFFLEGGSKEFYSAHKLRINFFCGKRVTATNVEVVPRKDCLFRNKK